MQSSIVGEEKLFVFPFLIRGLVLPGLMLAFGGGLLSGCVSSEKYEAEKARSLNFQRLLAQEEKRTGELNVKYQETQRKASELESQNRDLATEMEALREQLNRTQTELTRVREGGVSGQPSPGDDLTLAEPSISEFGLDDIEFKDSDLGDLGGEMDMGAGLGGDTATNVETDLGGDLGGGLDMDFGLEPAVTSAGESSTYHTVSRGETLFGISRQYGVTVEELKAWNNLNSNLIRIGQELRVSP